MLIPLRGKHGRGKYALIDETDVALISKFKWRGQRGSAPGIYYAVRANWDNHSHHATNIRMHRLIVGAKAGDDVDHINGDGLDNRRVNLRICSRSQNALNRQRKKVGCASKYLGVSWKRSGHKWMARITVDHKRIVLGLFGTEEAACAAYMRTRKECGIPAVNENAPKQFIE